MNYMKNCIIIVSILLISISIGTINYTHAQVIPISDIEFLNTGQFTADKNQFQISNDLNIREFSNGNIVRVSGQTLEGFPYVTYSKIVNEQTYTQGIIFINGKFVELDFTIISIQNQNNIEKRDDLAILVQYTQRVYDKQFVKIDVKVFDKSQNKLNDFYQNYAYVPNTKINLSVINEEKKEIYSTEGVTSERGFHSTQFLIPERSKIETLTVTITAENENSKSSKILQVFTLGAQPKDGKSS